MPGAYANQPNLFKMRQMRLNALARDLAQLRQPVDTHHAFACGFVMGFSDPIQGHLRGWL